jgi:hypothetical protein
MLRHSHEPAFTEKFIAAAGAGLLDVIYEENAMEHEIPFAALEHPGVMRERAGLDICAGTHVLEDRAGESDWAIVIHGAVIHGILIHRVMVHALMVHRILRGLRLPADAIAAAAALASSLRRVFDCAGVR